MTKMADRELLLQALDALEISTNNEVRNQNSVFHSPPEPNVKITFGDVSNTYFQFYIEKPPNKFQIWMLRKLLGIRMEKI